MPGSGIFIAAIVALSVAHKLRAVVQGTAQWHPIALRLRMPPPVASGTFLSASALEVCAVLGLFVNVRLASLALLAMFIGYTALGLATPSIRNGTSACDCFGIVDGRGGKAFLGRNTVIAAAAAASAAWPQTSTALSVASLTGVTVLFGVTLAAASMHQTTLGSQYHV